MRQKWRIYGLSDNIVGTGQLDAIDLCQEFFRMSIGMKLLVHMGNDERCFTLLAQSLPAARHPFHLRY
jgi:hypothetical protein